MYLTELAPRAGLAPAPGDALRGDYLRWMVFYGSAFEPAVVDRAVQRAAAPRSICPYADHDTVMAALAQRVDDGPWWLGACFTVADVLWGYALGWTSAFGLLPELPGLRDYLARVQARPAFQCVQALDAELAAGLAAREGD